MLQEAEGQLNSFDGSIDAIVGYMDFPVSTMLPILCRKFNVRSPSLESLLKCEHKFWSRSVQRATTAAVAVTEQGNRKVNDVSRQVSEAGETIRQLAAAVSDASQAAAQISASAGQQSTGMSQIKQAIGNIQQAAQQNLAATRQAESAAQELNRLGSRLIDLVGVRVGMSYDKVRAVLECLEDVRVIQAVLGHAHVQTTAHYARVTTTRLRKVKSPVDRIFQRAKEARAR